MDYGDLVRILLLIMGAFLIMVGNYVFPMQALFENSVWGTLKKAFFLSIMNLPRSFVLLLLMACPIVILLFFPETVYFLPFVCIAAVPHLKSEILIKVFDKYLPKKDEQEEESIRKERAGAEDE